MCGDDLALGEPSWLASLCSLKLARRPSTLPLPFLWANLTPLRPFPIVKTGRAGSLEVFSAAASGGFSWERWGVEAVALEGGVRRARRSWRGVRQLLNKRPCLVGGSLYFAQELAGQGWRAVVSSASGSGCRWRTVVRKRRAGAMLRSEGRRCSAVVQLESSLGWSGVLHVPALGSTHLWFAWRAGVCKLLRQLRQYVSVKVSDPAVARP